MYFLLTKILFNDESYILNARILSIFFSSVTFLYLYKICNIWTDWSISFFLCTLTLFSSDLFLGYSFEARPYSLCMMLVTLFCFSIIKSIFSSKEIFAAKNKGITPTMSRKKFFISSLKQILEELKNDNNSKFSEIVELQLL